MKRTSKERVIYYENQAGNWLSIGNMVAEKHGKTPYSEECYQKSARYLMMANNLREREARAALKAS